MAWRIDYTETAAKQLRKLDKKTARQILDFVDKRVALQADPRSIGTALKGPVLGAYWRYRVGDWRIICDIQDAALCVLVVEMGNRSKIYR